MKTLLATYSGHSLRAAGQTEPDSALGSRDEGRCHCSVESEGEDGSLPLVGPRLIEPCARPSLVSLGPMGDGHSSEAVLFAFQKSGVDV